MNYCNLLTSVIQYTNSETNVLANFLYHNFQQFNIIRYHKDSILIVSNSTNIVVVLRETDTLLPIGYMYHPALLVTFLIIANCQPL